MISDLENKIAVGMRKAGLKMLDGESGRAITLMRKKVDELGQFKVSESFDWEKIKAYYQNHFQLVSFLSTLGYRDFRLTELNKAYSFVVDSLSKYFELKNNQQSLEEEVERSRRGVGECQTRLGELVTKKERYDVEIPKLASNWEDREAEDIEQYVQRSLDIIMFDKKESTSSSLSDLRRYKTAKELESEIDSWIERKRQIYSVRKGRSRWYQKLSWFLDEWADGTITWEKLKFFDPEIYECDSFEVTEESMEDYADLFTSLTIAFNVLDSSSYYKKVYRKLYYGDIRMLTHLKQFLRDTLLPNLKKIFDNAVESDLSAIRYRSIYLDQDIEQTKANIRAYQASQDSSAHKLEDLRRIFIEINQNPWLNDQYPVFNSAAYLAALSQVSSQYEGNRNQSNPNRKLLL